MSGRRVLVVDDEADVQNLLRSVLEEIGYSVDCAGDGSEALERFSRARPDLVILDLMMPGLDGWKVLAELRKVPGGPPVVALSELEDVFEAVKAGAMGCLSKPFDIPRLIGVCRGALTPGA